MVAVRGMGMLEGQLRIRATKERVRWLKVLAATEGRTMQDLVGEALDMLAAATAAGARGGLGSPPNAEADGEAQ